MIPSDSTRSAVVHCALLQDASKAFGGHHLAWENPVMPSGAGDEWAMGEQTHKTRTKKGIYPSTLGYDLSGYTGP